MDELTCSDGIPETSLSGRSTRTALNVRRSNSLLLAKMVINLNRKIINDVGIRVEVLQFLSNTVKYLHYDLGIIL